MLYDVWTGGLTVGNAFNVLLEILGIAFNFGAYEEAYSYFSNFVSNITTAFSNPSVGDILRLIPDFASVLVQIIPGLGIASVIARAYDITMLI